MKTKCPYCGAETFQVHKRMIAGGMTSKGVKCSSCGRHAVHGLPSTIYQSVVMGVLMVFFLINAVKIYNDPENAWLTDVQCIFMFLGVYIFFCRILNGILFKLDKNNRKDVR